MSQQENTQPQVMQVVMAKSPAQLAAEAREAVLEARRQAFALLLSRQDHARETADEEELTVLRDGLDRYTFKVEDSDEIWLFSQESTTMSMLSSAMRSGICEDVFIRIPYTHVNLAPEGQEVDTWGLDGCIGLNITRFFKGKPQDVTSLVFQAFRRRDSDVNRYLNEVLKYGSFKLEWPTNATANAINLQELFILLTRAKDAGTVLAFDDGSFGALNAVNFVDADMFGPEHIVFSKKRAVAIGGGVATATVKGATFETKNTFESLEIRPASQEQIAAAIEAGRQSYELMTGSEGFNHVQFNGTSYTPDWRGRPIPQVVKSRVVIDPEGLRLLDQSVLSNLFNMNGLNVDLDRRHDEKASMPTDKDLMVLEPICIFFNLERCEWQQGFLKDVSGIVFRTNAFEKLVLAPERKRLVEALVVHTNKGGAQNVDLIDGKGGGAIFLLDGPPGTGKTLTAEATAEKLERPLYKVGLGELGTSAERMEGKLEQVLNIARRWNAVLLLDEADVFLEKRSTENLARNAMVAVFLRLMEYYNGILFLTTNRGDNFDPAVLSRVTLALHFKRPTIEGRKVIWTNLLGNADIKVTERELSNLADLDINGREIKNAINSSRALADADGVEVSYSHIRELTDASANFAEEVVRAVEESPEVSLINRLAAALMKLIR